MAKFEKTGFIKKTEQKRVAVLAPMRVIDLKQNPQHNDHAMKTVPMILDIRPAASTDVLSQLISPIGVGTQG